MNGVRWGSERGSVVAAVLLAAARATAGARDRELHRTAAVEAVEATVADVVQHVAAMTERQALEVLHDAALTADRECRDVGEVQLEDLLLHEVPVADTTVEHLPVVLEQLPTIVVECRSRCNGVDEAEQLAVLVASHDLVAREEHPLMPVDDLVIAEQLHGDLEQLGV